MSDGNKFLRGFFTAGTDISRAKMEAQAKQDEIRAQGAEMWKRTVYETETKREEAEKERAKDLEVAKIMAGKKAAEQAEFTAALRNAYGQQDPIQAPEITAPEAPNQIYQPAPQTGASDPTQELMNEISPGSTVPTEGRGSFTPQELPVTPQSLPSKLQQRGREIQAGSAVEGAFNKKKSVQDAFTNVDPEKFAVPATDTELEAEKYKEGRQDRSEDKLNKLMNDGVKAYDEQAYDASDKSKKQAWRNPFFAPGEDASEEAIKRYSKDARVAREIINKAARNTNATDAEIIQDTQDLMQLLNLPPDRVDPTQDLDGAIDSLAVKLGLSPDEVDSYKARLNQTRSVGALTKGVEPEVDTNERVTVISPDGKRGTIPASQLQEALKAGYKQ